MKEFENDLHLQDLHGYGLPSDIYSLGITMCEIANGYPPFSDMKLLEMMLAKVVFTSLKNNFFFCKIYELVHRK